MNYQREYRLFAASLIMMLLALAGCSDGTDVVVLPSSQSSSTTAVVEQQTLPKGLFHANYPVIDWVFNRTCSLAVNSYNQNAMDATIAYDSAAWVYPDDGHLVEGTQDCDKNALIQEA